VVPGMAGGISTMVSGHEVTKILIKLKEDFLGLPEDDRKYRSITGRHRPVFDQAIDSTRE
jgi:hypothetical protein